MTKLGIICLANHSGLGNQTRELAYMLRPYRILAIDSSSFSKNKSEHWEWYTGFSGYKVRGFPNNREVDLFLRDLTHVICVENPFNFHLLTRARQLGIKVYIQSNYEFCDHLNKTLILPEKFLMPSYWKIGDMKRRFGEERIMYLPPPTDPQTFKRARDVNFLRAGPHKEFLHVVGTLAAHDRNGTISILEALKITKEQFTLTIRSQHPLPDHYMTSDPRVRYIVSDVPDQATLYEGYDALIFPRRYGGLALTMNEALLSGLPVIMTDISPNNELLPQEWLVPAVKTGEFMARTVIDVYSADPKRLADKIDWLISEDCEHIKTDAYELGYNTFSPTKLRPLYDSVLT